MGGPFSSDMGVLSIFSMTVEVLADSPWPCLGISYFRGVQGGNILLGFRFVNYDQKLNLNPK